MRHRTGLWLMLLCLLVAAALRLPDLVDSPPGLHFDEAANGILAGDIGLRGDRPVFIPSYTGKEPLFFYLTGGLMRLIGESVYTLRLSAALLGVVTVAVTFWLGKELFEDRRIALIAAALLAVSFWHVLFSRLGFRAISQPLLQALAIACLYRGLRRDSWPMLIIAGVTLGLSAYTYLAVRIFPIPLALSLIPLLLSKANRVKRLRQLVAFAIISLVVAAPLVAYFIANPGTFWVRIDQVLPQNGSGATLLSSYVESIGMFFVSGDPYWRFNIPNRPLFNWLWGALMIVGWLVALVRLRRSGRSVERSAYLLVIVIPLFMLLPTAMATGDIVPSNLRAIGLLPFILFLPAIGLDAILEMLRRRFRGLLEALSEMRPSLNKENFSSAITTAVILALLIVGAISTARSYFQEWVSREDLFYDSDADLVAVAEYLSEQAGEDETLFLAAKHYRHPTLAFLSDRYDQIKWLPNSEALVLPDGGSAYYIFPWNSPAPEWAKPYLSSAVRLDGPTGPDGEPVFVSYRMSAPADVPITSPVGASFDNRVTLLGYEIDGGGDGQIMPVTLFWRVEESGNTGLQPFIHLEDAWGYRWSQLESFAYPSEQWTQGDVVIQQVELPLRPGMPPGPYRLRIGFFDGASGRQLGRLDDAGRYLGNAVVVDGIPTTVTANPDPLPEPPFGLHVAVGEDLTLLGYERIEDNVTAGASFWLALWWHAQNQPDPMATRLELVGPDNTGPIIVNSTQPVHNSYPFEEWSTPRFIIDHITPEVPENIQPGEYVLRLRLLDEGDKTITTADLGSIVVEDSERMYAPPQISYPMEAVFGNEIEFLGYDLEATGPGQFRLRLIWRALKEPTDSYTVFTHLLDLDGTCCVWQDDTEPRQGTYPTDGWLADEVIVDDYEIELPLNLPAGQYPLEIGFYLPETGTRLVVEVPGMRRRDALNLTRPLLIE